MINSQENNHKSWQVLRRILGVLSGGPPWRILEATHTLTGRPPLGRLAVYARLLGLQIMSYVNICNV